MLSKPSQTLHCSSPLTASTNFWNSSLFLRTSTLSVSLLVHCCLNCFVSRRQLIAVLWPMPHKLPVKRLTKGVATACLKNSLIACLVRQINKVNKWPPLGFDQITRLCHLWPSWDEVEKRETKLLEHTIKCQQLHHCNVLISSFLFSFVFV